MFTSPPLPPLPNCWLLLVLHKYQLKNFCLRDHIRLTPAETPRHARLRQLVTWPVKVGNNLSLSDWFKSRNAGWFVIYQSLGVGRAADSGSEENWFELSLCRHLIVLDKKLFLYYLFLHSSLILLLLAAYCREQSCDGLHTCTASHLGGGGG